MALPYIRVSVRRDRIVLGTRDRRVNPLAASMDDEGVSFCGESLGCVLVDGGLDKTEAQSAEKRQSRDPQHWKKKRKKLLDLLRSER